MALAGHVCYQSTALVGVIWHATGT
jgi:hypothetical protein